MHWTAGFPHCYTLDVTGPPPVMSSVKRMTLARTFVLLGLAVLGITGCSTQRVAITPLPDIPTKVEALAIADRHVRADPTRNGYQMTDTRYDERERAWIVYYKRIPPKRNQTRFDHNWFAAIVRGPSQIEEMCE
jgi:hypothetical protein